jgi:hypothetical protein
MNEPPHKPIQHPWRPALALAAATLAVLPADAQTVHVPAPPKPLPRPAWNCRAQQSVGATKIHASRQLDAVGASLTDSASWTDVYTADQKAPLTVSVNWHPRPKPMSFADGMATFYFRTAEPMTGQIRVRLGSRRTIEVPAGQSYDDPHHFSAYERIGGVLDLRDDDGALRWTLGGTAPGKQVPVVHEGAYMAGELSALKSGFEEVLAKLDMMQADFASRCQRR